MQLNASYTPDVKEQAPAVLLVEDEVLIRLALSDALQERGFKVYEAASAAEAIDILNSRHSAIELVFTDVRMPGDMDGWGLAAWLRRHHPGLPAVLTSGGSRSAAAAHGLGLVETFFAKPYEVDEVIECIRAIIDRKRLSDPSSAAARGRAANDTGRVSRAEARPLAAR